MAAGEKSALLKPQNRDDQKWTWLERLFPSGYFPELKQIVILAAPLIFTQLSQYLVSPIAIMFCGRLGKNELGAASLANSLINVMGLTIANGLATACDTVFSQIYGSVNRDKLGIALQRSLLSITLCAFPCIAILLNANSILVGIGQDPIVAKLSAEYLMVFAPGLLAYFLYVSLAKYLQTQNIIIPGLVIGVIANIVNIILQYVLVIVLDYGIRGSAAAQVATYMTFLVLTFLYIVISKIYQETWTGWDKKCLNNWGQFYRLGSFGLIMFCIEFWSFEAGLFFSGVLGTTALGAQTVVFQIQTIKFQMPLGLGVATSIRVGQHLGAGNSAGAKTACGVSLTVTWGISIILMTFMVSLRRYLPLLFTDSDDIVDAASNLLLIMTIAALFDDSVAVGGGILRGAGRQNIGALIIGLVYPCAVAVAYVLTFYTKLRVAGFWTSLACCVVVEAVLFFIIIGRSNWTRLAEKAVLHAKVNTSTGTEELIEGTGTTNDVLKVGLVVCGFVGLFIAGIMCRLLIPVPDIHGPESVLGNATNNPLTTLIP